MAPLFTPLLPRLGAYQVCAADRPLEEVAAQASGVHFGMTELVEALEAFGGAGTVNRARLARLYGGRRVKVVRGWRSEQTRFESTTLMSPYPDVSLSRLLPGTLVVTWTVSANRNRPTPH